jgi:uncharacterized protein (UPF0179 family)
MGTRKNALQGVNVVAEAKTKVTLIGTGLAKPGLEFVYEGSLDECKPCSLKKACNNLKEGKRYRIVSIRPTKHDCLIHRNGTYAVEVVESPVTALINAEMAIKNSRIRYEYTCTNEDCKSYDLCHPDGIIEGERYVVVDVIGNAPDPCEKGRTLQLVNLMSP